MSLLQLADECKLSPSPSLGISGLRENCCSAGSRLPFSPSSLLIYELYFPMYSVLQHLEVVVGEYESCLPGSALVYRFCCIPAPFCFRCKNLRNSQTLKKKAFFSISLLQVFLCSPVCKSKGYREGGVTCDQRFLGVAQYSFGIDWWISQLGLKWQKGLQIVAAWHNPILRITDRFHPVLLLVFKLVWLFVPCMASWALLHCKKSRTAAQPNGWCLCHYLTVRLRVAHLLGLSVPQAVTVHIRGLGVSAQCNGAVQVTRKADDV